VPATAASTCCPFRTFGLPRWRGIMQGDTDGSLASRSGRVSAESDLVAVRVAEGGLTDAVGSCAWHRGTDRNALTPRERAWLVGVIPQPRTGEICLADLDPTAWHEEGGRWPAVVISSDGLHSMPISMVIVVPLTGNDRGLVTQPRVAGPESGLNRASYARPGDHRSIDAAPAATADGCGDGRRARRDPQGHTVLLGSVKTVADKTIVSLMVSSVVSTT
jgi:mRNA interferase MazF